MKIIFYLIFVFTTICHNNLYAQLYSEDTSIDSLKQQLAATTNDSAQIKLCCRLAVSYLDIDKDSSTYWINDAIRQAKKGHNKKLLANSYQCKGFVLNKKGAYRKSINSLDTAIQIFSEIGYKKGRAEALSIYGLSNWRLGQLDKSLVAYNEILSMEDTPELKRSKLAATINSALIYEEQYRNDKAEAEYKKAVILSKEQDDLYGEMICYNNLSYLSRFKKKFKESVELSQKAIQIAIEIKNNSELHRAYSNLGATFTQMKYLDSAEFYLLKGYDVGTSVNDEARLIKTAWHLAELYTNNNQLEKAKKYALESLKIAKKTETIEDIAFGFEALYKIEKKQQNYSKASQLADSLIFWKDSIYKASSTEALAQAESGFNNKMLEKENERLDQEKDYLRNLFIGLCFLVAIILFSLWLFFKRKSAQKQLDIEMLQAQKLTEKIEAYRKKRATELHDDVGQELLLAKQSIQLNNTTEKTLEIVERALNKIRKISKDEYPYELNYIGLKESLEYLIDLVEKNSSIIISEELADLPSEIPKQQSLNIYRVFQEMLNNSIKHKSATAVYIGMKIEKDKIVLVYKDNGAGFDFKDKLNQGHSIGLKSIVNRVRILNAELKMTPSKEVNKYIINIPFNA